MTTITKAYKIKLIKPVDASWDTAGQCLRDIDYYVRRVKNTAITNAYMNIISQIQHDAVHGKGSYAKAFKEDHGKMFSAHNAEITKQQYDLSNHPLEIFNTAIREAEQVCKIKLKDILKGQAVLPTFKQNQPIPVRNRMITLTKEDGRFYGSFAMLSKSYADTLERTGKHKGRIRFLLSSKGQEKVILDRLTDGTYKLCDSHIQRKGRDWYFIATYQFESSKDTDLIAGKVLGIDLGITKAAYFAVSDSPKSDWIDGGEIEHFRRTTEMRRNSMRNQLRVASENRQGHGRKTLLKPLEKLESKVSNFRKLTNQRYARHIVDYALKNQCSIVQMEDLTGISKHDNFLRNWTYFDLQTKIENLCKEHGIVFRRIDPAYTSQRCYRCGNINKENRTSQKVFRCQSCDHKANADRNAAQNISIDGIEEIIADQMKLQRKLGMI